MTLVVAAVLHAAAIAAVRLATPGSTPPPVRAHEEPIAIEGTVEMEPAPITEPPHTEPATSPPVATREPQRVAAMRETATTARETAGTAGRETSGSSPDGTPATTGPGEGAPITLHRADIGLGGTTFLKPGALPEPAGASPERTPRSNGHESGAQASMWKTARDRDTELGLGPEGPVLRALMEETRATATPTRGRAIFMATANAAGEVTSVDVIAYSGDGGGWSDAAKQALAALKGKRLRLPSTAKGAELLIEISSDRRMPSGHHAGADVSLFNIPLKRGDGPQATRIDIVPLLPKIVSVPLDADGKMAIPLPMINFTLLGVAGDPADIGAKVQRVVHSRLMGSRIL